MDASLAEQTREAKRQFSLHMSRLEFAKALEAIFNLVDSANKYINDQKPWTLFKEGKQVEGESVLITSLEILRSATIMLYPFIPNIAENMWKQLGFDRSIKETIKSEDYVKGHDTLFDTREICSIKSGQQVKLEGPVFKRIEEPVLSS
jgi:methionyl-tRNA synthetase